VPALIGARNVVVAFALMSPVLNAPLLEPSAVTVWATWSLLWTVTVVPGATVNEDGRKVKASMSIVVAPDAGVLDDPAAGATVEVAVDEADRVLLLLPQPTITVVAATRAAAANASRDVR
jgi:hypothetical protein